jgi:hypothetical protein
LHLTIQKRDLRKAIPPLTAANFFALKRERNISLLLGLNTYPGLLSFFDSSFWRPLEMVDKNGVFGLEPSAFKEYFAGLGIAK